MTSNLRLARVVAERVVRAASRRLPAGIREEVCQEWLAEIPVILEDPSIRNGWRRVGRALWFAADQWRGIGALSALRPDRDEGEPERASRPLVYDVAVERAVVVVHVSKKALENAGFEIRFEETRYG